MIDALEAELSALSTLVEVLRDLDPDAQRRVLMYAASRFEAPPVAAQQALPPPPVSPPERKHRRTRPSDARPTRSARVIECALGGASPRDIAARLNMPSASVTSILSTAAKAGTIVRTGRGRYASGGAS